LRVRTIQRTQFLPFPRDEVFAFFSSPENLSRITPESLGFHILTPSPIVTKAGAVIDYTIHLGFFPVRWRTLITTYEPPYQFVDEQIKGPYSFWHHRHSFRSVGEGTEMQDVVNYVLPGWLVGDFAHFLIVRRQLEAIFDYRARVLPQLLGDGTRRVIV
jgi:ligand-binding SRPBCC domain-containing protein